MQARKWMQWLVVCALCAPHARTAAPAPKPAAPVPVRHRALLIGINDYSASQLPASKTPPPPRDWSNLYGAVNDVETMRGLLIERYGFTAADIVTLTNQQATRKAILERIETHLRLPAKKGDIVLFYYSGHGSQVKNTRSAERDKLDESIVPADARRGEKDILDKELRVRFNGILDRGAQLTVVLDHCHSGSGARGLMTGEHPRGLKADLRDIADPTVAGPAPEARGALVLAATQDFDYAWETTDDQDQPRGAFSWALARALRDRMDGEAAIDTFRRAQAMVRAESPLQEPVIAGNATALLTPFLGRGRGADKRLIAVEKITDAGSVVLQAGWAHGLTVGSQLRLHGKGGDAVRLEVTAMKGLGRCEARLVKTQGSPRMPASIRPGALMEIAKWSAPAGRPLRVWIPVTPAPASVMAFARELFAKAEKKGIGWIDDPIEKTPVFVVRWRDDAWEVLGPGSTTRRFTTADAILAVVPSGQSLFLQLPVPAAVVRAMPMGARTDYSAIQPVGQPQHADYFLAGRFISGRIEYAWIRPGAITIDHDRNAMPLRTKWYAPKSNEMGALVLRDAALRLRRVQGWQLLESPPGPLPPYRLGIRRARDRALVKDGKLMGGQDYGFVLRARAPLPPAVPPRYVYAFMIDTYGKSILIYPELGSVENRVPLSGRTKPPEEIALGAADALTVTPPYGLDTYYLLTTDEALVTPSILEWDGVRTKRDPPVTALEQLLDSAGNVRSGSKNVRTPANWSIERVVYQSLPPPAVASR